MRLENRLRDYAATDHAVFLAGQGLLETIEFLKATASIHKSLLPFILLQGDEGLGDLVYEARHLILKIELELCRCAQAFGVKIHYTDCGVTQRCWPDLAPSVSKQVSGALHKIYQDVADSALKRLVRIANEMRVCEPLPVSVSSAAESTSSPTGSEQQESRPLTPKRCITDPGTSWGAVTITIMGDDRFVANVDGERTGYDCRDLGLRHEQTGRPLKGWDFLVALSKRGSISSPGRAVPDEQNARTKENLETRVRDLNRRLSYFFDIEGGKAIEWKKEDSPKSWEPAFQLISDARDLSDAERL